MFFTSELLASRDSGFGLLWYGSSLIVIVISRVKSSFKWRTSRLAATLGSKSAFKKLPKRSIITADIAQLCDLIAEPLEPLALRLSSNLLVGVARYALKRSFYPLNPFAQRVISVYKGVCVEKAALSISNFISVKQDIFLNDVSACFSSLKKMVQDFRSTAVMDARLQLAQGSVRPSVVTLSANLQGTIAMDFDAFITDWDEYLNIGDQPLISVDTDDENFDPQESHTRKKGKKPKANVPLSQAEHPRAELYTLSEHHDHILSASFDLSFNGDGNDAIGLSSSHATDFGFDDNIFAMSDGLDVGVLADELAKELGWATPTKDGEIQDDAPILLQDITMEEQNRADTEIKKMKKTRLLLDARTELTDEELKVSCGKMLPRIGFNGAEDRTSTLPTSSGHFTSWSRAQAGGETVRKYLGRESVGCTRV
ncbi:hypothetical protein H0H87_000147 [Tephrocybe sp. NHM501043]|nr:hypothetical protein H0H87_000147 [Tephrocybe sp. NHM501043]